MGLLDYQNQMGAGLSNGLLDPKVQGLLQAGFAGLAASGPSRAPQSFGQVVGQAGQAGMQAFQQSNVQNQAMAMRQLQMEEMQRAQTARQQAAAAQAKFAETLTPQERMHFEADPAGFLKQKLENPFSKIDPKDYTPESVSAFSQSRDPSKLVPVRKNDSVTTVDSEGNPVTAWIDAYNPPKVPLAQPVKRDMVNLGGSVMPVNPYTQTGPLTRTASPDTLLTNATTIRGQNLVDGRSRDANAIAAGQRLSDQITSVRKEFNSLPEVQNYRAVVPIVESAKKAPNTPAGDLDLIYAVGKTLDPNSVVREGELALVIKSGSPMERFQGMVNYVQGGGRLPPEQRKKLTDMLESRSGELKKGYESAKSTYERDAQRRGLPADQVFMDLGDTGRTLIYDPATGTFK